jgi:hypothetical protein
MKTRHTCTSVGALRSLGNMVDHLQYLRAFHAVLSVFRYISHYSGVTLYQVGFPFVYRKSCSTLRHRLENDHEFMPCKLV